MTGNMVRLIKCVVVGVLVLNASLLLCLPYALAAEVDVEEQVAADALPNRAIAVAIVVSVSSIAAGYAVARVGSAAIGAISEKPEVFGRTLVFVGLAEGIAIYGLIIGIMMLVA